MLSIFDDSKQYLRRVNPVVDSIMKLQPTYTSMSDLELKRQTEILKQRLQNGETIEDI